MGQPSLKSLASIVLITMTVLLLPSDASGVVYRNYRGRTVAVPDHLFERWQNYPPNRLAQAQATVDAAAQRLGLQYRPVVDAELIMYVGNEGGHANGNAEFRDGRITVKISPDIVKDPVLLELTLIHEDVHFQQFQRLQRMFTVLEEPVLEVEAYEAELREAERRGLRNSKKPSHRAFIEEIEYRLDVQRFLSDQIAKLKGQGIPDREIARRLNLRGEGGQLLRESGFEEELKKKSSTEPPKSKTEVRKLEIKNKLLKELISERMPPELKRIGNAGEYIILFDLNEEILSGKIKEKFNVENLKRNFPEIAESPRGTALENLILEKLHKDRLYELHKAKGEILWGERVDLTPKEREAVIKTRAFLRTLKDFIIKKPDIGFFESLKLMSAGEAGILFGPILVNGAVAWYDHGWQAGLATIGLEGSLAVGIMFLAHYSPGAAIAAHLYFIKEGWWPVLVYHVAKGVVYVSGSLFEDYLIRDNMVRLFYLERGATVSGLGLPAGTKIPNFFDSPYGQGLTRTTLHTKYKTKEEVEGAIEQYKAWLKEQDEAVAGQIWFALRDVWDSQVIWDRIEDRAKADWFESMAKEMEELFKLAENKSKASLVSVEGQAEALRSLANKEYEGAQGFILDVKYEPEKPKVDETVSIEITYAIAGVTDENVTVDLPIKVSGPEGDKLEKLLDQKEFSFDEDHPLIIGSERMTLKVSAEGNYEVAASLQLSKGQSDHFKIAFATTLKPTPTDKPDVDSTVKKLKDLRERILALGSIRDELYKNKSLVEKASGEAKSIADSAGGRLDALRNLSQQLGEISTLCNDAATIRGKIESAAVEAEGREKQIRTQLDRASELATSCKNKDEAQMLRDAFRNSLQALRDVGRGKSAAQLANEELKQKLKAIEDKKKSIEKAKQLADEISSDVTKVKTQVEQARQSGEAGENLRGKLVNGIGYLRAEIEALERGLTEEELTEDIKKQFQELRSLLASMNPGDFNFPGLVAKADEQASRIADIDKEAQTTLSKYGDARCDVTSADNEVELIDNIVTGLTVEVTVASDLPQKAAACLAKLEDGEGPTPTPTDKEPKGKVPQSVADAQDVPEPTPTDEGEPKGNLPPSIAQAADVPDPTPTSTDKEPKGKVPQSVADAGDVSDPTSTSIDKEPKGKVPSSISQAEPTAEPTPTSKSIPTPAPEPPLTSEPTPEPMPTSISSPPPTDRPEVPGGTSGNGEYIGEFTGTIIQTCSEFSDAIQFSDAIDYATPKPINVRISQSQGSWLVGVEVIDKIIGNHGIGGPGGRCTIEDGVLRCEETSSNLHYTLDIKISGNELVGEHIAKENGKLVYCASLKAARTK